MGVERLVEVGEGVALLGGAGLRGVGVEVRGQGVVQAQVALRHVLAEGALHHAGVDEFCTATPISVRKRDGAFMYPKYRVE